MANIRTDLDRWVDAGVLDDETASNIERFELSHSGSKVGRGVEALAYLGSVLVLVALALLAFEFWDRLEPWGQVTLSAAVTVLLFGVGVALGQSDEPAVSRGQTFAWFLTVAAVGLTAFVAIRSWITTEEPEVFLWTSLTALGASIGLWILRASVLQMVAFGGSAAVAAVSVITQIDDPPDWVFGLTLAGLGALWLALAWVGVFKPAKTSYVLGGVGLLLIAFPEGGQMPWPLLGLVAGLLLMAASVWLSETVLLGLGVAGLFVYIPMTIFELFGESLGVPVALLATGLILLAVVVFTVRLRRQ